MSAADTLPLIQHQELSDRLAQAPVHLTLSEDEKLSLISFQTLLQVPMTLYEKEQLVWNISGQPLPGADPAFMLLSPYDRQLPADLLCAETEIRGECNIAMMRLPKHGYTLYLGPNVLYAATAENLRQFSELLGLSADALFRIIVWLSRFDTLKNIQFNVGLSLLCSRINGSYPGSYSIRNLMPASAQPSRPPEPAAAAPYSSSHRLENALEQAVSEGRPELVMEAVRPLKTSFTTHTLYTRNRRQELQILYISMVTLLSRMAIRGGLSYDYATALASRYYAMLPEIHFSDMSDLLLRIATHFATEVQQVQELSRQDAVVLRIMQWTGQHISEPCRLCDAAKDLQVSVPYLSSRFSKMTGMTYSVWRTKEKNRIARHFLESTDDSVASIAERLGYGSQDSFQRAFLRDTGENPAAYRRRLRAGH